MPTLDLSVIICTHNPRKAYLDRTLEALLEQTVPTDRWELILVDNASSQAVAGLFDISWNPHGRHVLERELGLASARQRGILESSGQLLVFVDDDNVLAPDYLAEALRIEKDCRFLGAWGSGSISLEFEVNPSDHLKSFLPWLGLREFEKATWSNAIGFSGATPIGAGLCVRRRIGEAYVEFSKSSSTKISGRKGASLGGHEDFEICYLACNAGLGMGVFPTLKILHLIAKERVTDRHILKLVEDSHLSHYVLENKWMGTLPSSPFSLRGAPAIALNLLRRRGFERLVYFAELRAIMATRRMLLPTVPHSAGRDSS